MSDSFGEYVCARCMRVGVPSADCLRRKCEPPKMSVPCSKCRTPHEVGMFSGHPLPEVQVIDTKERTHGQRGRVVDWWHWVGSAERIRVEFADRKRVNFAPCQLRRMPSARFESVEESRKAAVAPAVRHEHRAAILSSLYDERHRLNRSKRLGQATANELEYLTDLNAYIAEWERAEVREAQQRDSAIWARLVEVAAGLVASKSKAKYEESVEESRKAAVAAGIDRLIRFKGDLPVAGHEATWMLGSPIEGHNWTWCAIDWAGKPKPTGRQRTRALWRRRGRR